MSSVLFCAVVDSLHFGAVWILRMTPGDRLSLTPCQRLSVTPSQRHRCHRDRPRRRRRRRLHEVTMSRCRLVPPVP